MLSSPTNTKILTFALVGFWLIDANIAAADDTYVLKDVKVVFKDGESPRIFTSEEMKEFDGSDEHKPIYIGIKGVVFDVTSGKNFYNKKSDYNILVGKDSTRAVAKMSLDAEDMSPDVSGLPGHTLKMLDEVFEQTYMKKYPIAGYMDYFKEKFPEKFSASKMEL